MEWHPNGFYTFSDSDLKRVKKQDLINYIRTIEKNWENVLITNKIQYKNCKKLLAEEHNKTIDEFLEQLKDYKYGRTNGVYIEIPLYKINEIAEEMRGAE